MAPEGLDAASLPEGFIAPAADGLAIVPDGLVAMLPDGLVAILPDGLVAGFSDGLVAELPLGLVAMPPDEPEVCA